MNKKADKYSDTGLRETKGGRGRISLRSLKTFESFKNPAYRIYYGAMACQWLPMSMQMVVRSLLVYRLTGSGAILGGLTLAHAIPLLFISLFGGAIADRVQKKNVLLICQAGSAVVSLGVAFALMLGYLSSEHAGSWWVLIVASVLHGVIMGFMMPSRTAIISEIVSEEQLMNAISLNNLGTNTFRLMGPALAGFLVDALDFDVTYYIMTVMYVVATVFIAFLPRIRAITVHGSSALRDVVEGIRYIRREKTILLILVFSLLGMIFGLPYMFLLPMFTEDILKVGATGMGFLASVSGLGAILGSLILASLPNRKRGVMLILSSLIMGLVLIGFSFSHWWYPSLVLIAFVGLGQSGMLALGIILIQSYAEASYRGRVISFHMMGVGFASLGTFFAGTLAEAVGIQWSVGGMAMAMALISILVLTFAPRLRKLD